MSARVLHEDKDFRVIEVGKDIIAEKAKGHDRMGNPIWPDADDKAPAGSVEHLQGQVEALTRAVRKYQEAEDARRRAEEEDRYKRGGPDDR
jgi:hypothetical protein